jgi:ABC-type sugar transport system ATPase subunit
MAPPGHYPVNLNVHKGEIVALSGPMPGKTTLMYALAGILSTTEGEIIFRGSP